MATLKEKLVFPGVPNTIRGEPSHISISPTAASITYASGRVAVVRSLTDPLQARVFPLHTAPVTVARYSPDGSLIASADDGGTVRLWLPDTAVQKAEFHATPAPIRHLAFSPCGKYIVVAGESRAAYGKVLKLPSGGGAGLCKGHTKRAVTCDAAKGWVVTGSEDMSLGVFKGPVVREFDTPVFLRHHTGFVNEVKFSPDGRLLAVASSDRTVSIVEMDGMEVLKTLSGHGASVTGVAWMAGERLLTSSNDKTTRVWSLTDGSCVSTHEHGRDVADMQVGCGYSKEGHVVSVSLRPQVNITDPGESSPTRVLRGHAKVIVGLAAVGERVYTADYSGLLVAWDAAAGPLDVPFTGKSPATSVCAIAANEDVVANVGQDGKVFITDANTRVFKKPLTVKGGGVGIAVPARTGSLSAVMVNETRLVAVSPDGGEIIAELTFDRTETGTCVAITRDGGLLAVGVEQRAGGGCIRFYKLADGFSQTRDEIRMASPPSRVAFSPDGESMAVGEKSRRVKLYSVKDGGILTGGGSFHTARVDAIAFDDEGQRVVSGGMDGSVAVWPVGSEDDPVKVKAAHRNGVTGAAFVTGGVVTAGGDSCVRVWTLA